MFTRRSRRIVFGIVEQRRVDKIPVDEEGALKSVDTAALNAEHRVAPPVLHVAHGNVHAPDIAHAAVDDEKLAVVAIVSPAGEGGEAHGHERLHLDALAAHALEETGGHVPAPYVVVDDAHLDALARLGHKGVADELTQGIVLEDVDVDVNVAGGTRYVAQQGWKELIAVGEHLDVVATERQGEALVDKKVDEGLLGLRQGEVTLLHKAVHGALGELVHGAPADLALVAPVLAEEDVGDDANDGHKIDD